MPKNHQNKQKQKKIKKEVRKEVKNLEKKKHGGLATAVSSGIRALGGFAGPVGKALSTALAPAAGRFVGSIFGKGAYEVYGADREGPQRFVSSPDVVIAHREYITDIVSTKDFTLTNYTLNPKNATLFPWLSSLASNWQEWELDGMLFEYRSKCTHLYSTTNPAVGTIIMGANYNIFDLNYASKIDMENCENAVSCLPTCDFYHMIECKGRANNPIKTMYTDLQGGQTSFNTLANWQIATQGMQLDNMVLGELWVTYKIRFRKPKLSMHATAANTMSMYNVGSYTGGSDGYGAGMLGRVGSNGLLLSGLTASGVFDKKMSNSTPYATLSQPSTSKYTISFNPKARGSYAVVVYGYFGASTYTGAPFSEDPTYTNCVGCGIFKGGLQNAVMVYSQAGGGGRNHCLTVFGVTLGDGPNLDPNLGIPATVDFYFPSVSPTIGSSGFGQFIILPVSATASITSDDSDITPALREAILSLIRTELAPMEEEKCVEIDTPTPTSSPQLLTSSALQVLLGRAKRE